MNIEAYNLDSLRKLIRDLQRENQELRDLLDKADIPYAESEVFASSPTMEDEYDPDQGARIYNQFIDKNMATNFFAMFWGREDVFAKRAKNGNYYPQCDNRWNSMICPKQKGEKQYCEDCDFKNWTKLKPEILRNHLIGSREEGTDVIGVYPLLPDGTCRFLVFDFDNHEKEAEKKDFANDDEAWHDEVDALRMICEQNGIDALVERSRSGRGAHVWIFFRKPISAAVARNFGFLLLDVYDYIDPHIPDFDKMYLKRLRTYKKIGFRIVSDITPNKQEVNAIYDSGNYTDTFEQDLIEAENEIVISSPGIIQQKIERFIYLMKSRQEAGVKITVITENPENASYGNTAFLYTLIEQMRLVGINVKSMEDEVEHFAVIDRSLVWHGGMNLLGKEDAWDNLIRVKDMKAAAELLALSFGKIED